MTLEKIKSLFSPEKLEHLFPPQRADQFFEALLGDAADGAYDIRLAFSGITDHQLRFDFELHQRPGKCLACNLTYGLPGVFTRHPIIDAQGLVRRIDDLLDGKARCGAWKLGATREINRKLHVIPLTIDLQA